MNCLAARCQIIHTTSKRIKKCSLLCVSVKYSYVLAKEKSDKSAQVLTIRIEKFAFEKF